MTTSSVAKAVSLLVLFSLFGCTRGTRSVDPVSRQPEFLEPAQRTAAADFSEKDVFDTQDISLSSYKGKVVLLNFWATWCPPCRKEIPALVRLQKSYGSRLEVVGVSVYSYTSTTEKFYESYWINYPMIYGSYELMGKYGDVGSIPTTFLIDKEGRIAARLVGSRAESQYKEMIASLVAE